MADDDDTDHRSDHPDLINGLKSVVEGLLATQTLNVWNTYGGLDRVCKDVERILYHGLRSTQGDFGQRLEFWPFVQGLKRLNPVLAPDIDRISRATVGNDDKGHTWLRECLREHKLSQQLIILVRNKQHLQKYYYDYAFLCSEEYFNSMLTCLQAIEQNKVDILADLNLKLLQKKDKQSTSHAQSAPVQMNITKGRQSNHSDALALAPPFASPKRESILCTSDEHAVPSNIGASTSPEETKALAKDALRSVLRKSGSESPIDGPADQMPFSFYDSVNSDPLLNMEFSPPGNREFTLKRTSVSEIQIRNPANAKTKGTLRRSQSEITSIVSRTNNSEIMDRIFNDEEVKAVKRECKNPIRTSIPEGVFSDSESHVVSKDMAAKNNNSKKGHKRSRSDLGGLKSNSDSNIRKSGRLSCDNQIGSATSGSNKNDLAVNQEGYFPQPVPGQSLINYLSSHDFHTCATLDKENAHFSISEALIAAIEQMKWNHVIAPQIAVYNEEEDVESDEEIQQLKQRIRIRKRERLKEKARGFPAFSDGVTDTTASKSTSSPFSSHSSSPYMSDSAESSEGEDQQIELTMSSNTNDLKSNLTLLNSSGLSLSLASLYSDADIQKSNTSVTQNQSGVTDSGTSNLSAESVAISLLKKFSEKQLPKASDLQWLVSEKDVPQKLLPLPNSYPVSPDDGDDFLATKTRLRGNHEWAPPRPQIIFDVHLPQKRNIVMLKQNYLCAGCGTKVEPGYVKRYRYCEYIGKYFCHCCHSNAVSYIPGKILRKWDFKKYSVSNFSRDFISRIFEDPLFNLCDINASLYRKVKLLETVRDYRIQLQHLYKFIKICKKAFSILSEFLKLPTHWYEEIHQYSLSDLVNVKNLQMVNRLRNMVNNTILHIEECTICQGFGFICELCNDKEIIFPFQLEKVARCEACHACFHKQCFIPEKCPKCARIDARRQRLEEQFSAEKDDIE